MFMSSISGVSSRAHHRNSSSRTSSTTLPTTPTNSTTEPASFGAGFAALQDHSGGDKSYAAQLGLTPPAKDYSELFFCAYTPGQYTEF